MTENAPKSPIQVSHLDHLVLTVAHIEVTCAFYTQVMGMTVETFAQNRKALKFGNQKINLHQKNHEFEPKAQFPTPGSADLCFITHTPLTQVIAHLQQLHVPILEQNVTRTGARGSIISVYFRDPDGNLIELSNTL